MQGGQGRRGRQGYTGRGAQGGSGANHMNGGTGVTYGGMPGSYVFNPWLGFNPYNVQGLMPLPPVLPHSYTRGSGGTRPGVFVPLAVQGAGILKRPAGPPAGTSVQGRSRTRGHGRRSGGSRGRKEKNVANLTKEALDADLDEWRMKDKKLGGSSLDAELDEYWKKKSEVEGEQEEGENINDSKTRQEEDDRIKTKGGNGS